MFRFLPLATLLALGSLTFPASSSLAQEPDSGDEGWFDWGVEGKFHFRSSEGLAIEPPFMFPEILLPVGETMGFMETVDEGDHFELSTVTIFLDARPSSAFQAHLKVDLYDLYDRNPTSGDREVDIDEAWVRFGRETVPGLVPDSSGAYVKLGKMGRFERQDDRHLESYGLVSTAFNRFEDLGAEAGFDLGRRVYVKFSSTSGNPLFMRDPNALAGDNGIDEQRLPNPDPELKSGFTILYDAEIEDFDIDSDLELAAGLGVRVGPELGPWNLELLLFGSQRDLRDSVTLEGTFYGGDLDLLKGPFDLFPFPTEGRRKRETGANLWLYAGGFSAFAQWVDQDLAGLERTGVELELAWEIELPLVWAPRGRQLFPYVAPALRYSHLDPHFAIPEDGTPSPSWTWDWDKWDLGLRLGIWDDSDLTVEYARHEFVLASGDVEGHDELLTTLRWRI